MSSLLARIRRSWDEDRHVWIFAAIIVIAIFFRFWRLSSVPPGVHPDEAANGLDIIRMIEQGDFRVLYNTNGPREALFFYLQLPFVWLLGGTSLALRMAPALIGVASVIVLYLFVRLIWGVRAALVTSFLMAIDPWHITMTRDGFRASMTPLITTLVLYLYARAIRDRSWRDFLLAGFFLGLGFYTYLSYRLFPLVIVALMAWLGWRYWDDAKSYIRPLFASFGMAAITLIPLLIYGLYHPGDLGARAGGTSVFNSALNNGDLWGTLAHNIGATALMFTVQGDANYRHNLGGLPLLDPVTGVLFIVGIVYFVARISRPTYALVLIWLGVMLLPNILSAEGIPHALRSIGAIPPAMIIAGVCATWVWTRILGTFPQNRYIQRTLVTLVLVLATFTTVYSYQRYFVVWAKSPATHQAYSQDTVDMAAYHNSLVGKGYHQYAVTDGYSAKTLEYMTWQRAGVVWVDPKKVDGLELPAGKSVVTFGMRQLPDLARFQARYGGGKLTAYTQTYNGQAEFQIYEVTR